MRDTTRTRARLLALATLSTFAVLAPTASADTTQPVWTCRASAGYVEVPGLLGTTRVEPVLANGFPDSAAPDSGQCASSDAGVQNVAIPAGPAGNPTPLVALNAAFARTTISPEIAAARDQTAAANGGVTDPLHITLGALDIVAQTVSAQATGSCAGTTPTLTGSSTVVQLSINNAAPITIPTNAPTTTIDLSPVAIVTFNEQVTTGDATSPDQALTQRAVHIQVLPVAASGATPATPAANIVLGEAKVDRHGAVCAPAPPPPVCTAPAVAVAGSNPLVCALSVVQCAPGSTQVAGAAAGTCVQVCPGASTADPATGACVIPAPAASCPAGTTRDPKSNTCILLVQRPCPAGATPDPSTRVCVVTVHDAGTSTIAGENGRVGGSGGPVATCGRIEMHFVKGGKRTLTNRFGNRVVTRGRLVTCGANPRPIVGARIDVVHVLPGGKRLRKTGLRSRSGGKMTLILPLDLRSRRIEYAYRPDLRRTKVTSRVTLRLTVRDRNGRVLNK
ncbi:MAG: hypothetical protein QOE11_712 [Solirubrobacteraceae bacterium]|jgi:hypothetical protein|nr:hypothetical protein [Solirubrobacteraceae bacterium]